MWIHKEKRRLYEQCNFAAASETEDGIPLLCLKKLDGSEMWLPREQFEKVTFEQVEKAFIQLGITY
jgi:hypothetical protein